LSCSKHLAKQDECYEIELFIKKNWYYDKELDYYKEGPELLSLTGKRYNCIIGLKKTEIVTLFGEPSEVDSLMSRYIYYESPEWHENSKYCSFLFFKFENGIVMDFRFIITSPPKQ